MMASRRTEVGIEVEALSHGAGGDGDGCGGEGPLEEEVSPRAGVARRLQRVLEAGQTEAGVANETVLSIIANAVSESIAASM